MFGPTFASLSNLSSESAIIISESDHLGKVFFKDLYNSLNLNIFEYTFDEHDETVAYSLSIPVSYTHLVALPSFEEPCLVVIRMIPLAALAP